MAARGASVLVKALENPKETDSNRLFGLGQALAALAERMDPKEAASVADSREGPESEGEDYDR